MGKWVSETKVEPGQGGKNCTIETGWEPREPLGTAPGNRVPSPPIQAKTAFLGPGNRTPPGTGAVLVPEIDRINRIELRLRVES